MAKSLLLLLALSFCVLPALVASRSHGRPFYVQGRVYCDTCRAGFETNVTTYVEGARVRVYCKDRKNLETVYEVGAVTDSTGTYEAVIEDDHADQICQCELVSSPVTDCQAPDEGRNRSTIILTRSNGVANDIHYANPMGFLTEEPLPCCKELLKYYLQDE